VNRERRAQGRSARGEGGYALLAVLAVIAMTSITIAALFGMLLTTIRVTADQERDARELRAADGAVTAAVNHLRLNQSGNQACTALDGGLVVPFDQVDGPDDVTVSCESAADDFGPPAGDVKLLGDSYEGAMAWSSAAGWSSLPGGTSLLSGADPVLVHSGSAALRFNGNVNAGRDGASTGGIAAVRNPGTGAFPAVEVRGQAKQPVAGIGSSSGDPCGVLASPDGAAQVDATAGLTCAAPSGDIPTAVLPAYPVSFGPSDQRTVPAACPTGSVVTLQPGRYDSTQVATLNQWFGGGCPGRTFHFPSGIYAFDAGPAIGGALVFDDASSSFVFGEANGWSTDPASGGATAANFPNACRTGVSATAPGASIVLSARTALHHLAGRLAVCPYVSPLNTAYPAVLQQATTPTNITVSDPTSTASSSPVSAAFSQPANLISGSPSTFATARLSCSNYWQTNVCTGRASFEVRLSGTGSGSSGSTRISLSGSEASTNTLIASRKVQFVVTPATGAACTTASFDGAPNTDRTNSYELVSGGCASMTAAGAFDGARVRANFTYEFKALGTNIWPGQCYFDFNYGWVCPTVGEDLRIWNVTVDSGVHYGTVAAGDVTEGRPDDYDDHPNVALDDANSATMQRPACGEFDLLIHGVAVKDRICDYRLAADRPRARSLTLNDVSVPPNDATLPDDASVQSLDVLVRFQRAGDVTAKGDGTRVTVTLTPSSGAACSNTYTGLSNSTQDVAFDLSTCLALTVGQIRGADLTVTTEPACYEAGENWFVNGAFVWAWRCGGPEQPKVQHVALMLTTDHYEGPVVRSELHVDAPASGAGSSANFFGAAYLQRTALDVYWDGQRSGASIFGGELQLHSLGSQVASGATVDVLCCTKPEVDVRRVKVVAWVGGSARLTATVQLDRVTSAVSVLDWTVCRRNGSCPV
jgi:hypothetical protein